MNQYPINNNHCFVYHQQSTQHFHFDEVMKNWIESTVVPSSNTNTLAGSNVPQMTLPHSAPNSRYIITCNTTCEHSIPNHTQPSSTITNQQQSTHLFQRSLKNSTQPQSVYSMNELVIGPSPIFETTSNGSSVGGFSTDLSGSVCQNSSNNLNHIPFTNSKSFVFPTASATTFLKLDVEDFIQSISSISHITSEYSPPPCTIAPSQYTMATIPEHSVSSSTYLNDPYFPVDKITKLRSNSVHQIDISTCSSSIINSLTPIADDCTTAQKTLIKRKKRNSIPGERKLIIWKWKKATIKEGL